MATITYDVTSGKPLIVGYVEETGVNTVILTGFTQEGTGTTVYISIEGIGLLDLTASTTVTGGYEFPIDYTITVMDGKFEAFLVEKNVTNTYIRKSQPFEVRVKRNGRIAIMAKEIQMMLHDWFNQTLQRIESRLGTVEETIPTLEKISNKKQHITTDSNDTDYYPSVDAVTEYSEALANKVQEVTSTGTEEQYPSAKAVYEALQSAGKVDDVRVDGTSVVTDRIANINGKENTSNKVTEVTSTSTDTQYPSAKATYTIVNAETTRATTAEAAKENLANKVTEMSASSTDTEYPSAKCVYEAIQGAEGKVNDVKVDGVSVVTDKVANVVLTGKENISNKTTTVTSTSTDTQYPSAKAVYTSVNAEATARSTADATLQDNIDTEASTRSTADTTLQNNIDAEETRAKGVENTISSNLSTEITNRENADTQLQTNINNEATTRGTADTQLQTNISNEETRAKGVEATKENLSNKVTTVSEEGTDTQYPSAKAVYTAIASIPGGIVYRGTLAKDGTGTVEMLPNSSQETVGWMYRVIQDGNYNPEALSEESKVGDEYIGAETSGTATYYWSLVPGVADKIQDVQVNDVSVVDAQGIAKVVISGKEDIANKTDTIGAGTSTNYPSTKAVADYWDTQNKFYWCTYGTTTYDEITQALADGKFPIVTYVSTEGDEGDLTDGNKGYYTHTSGGYHHFAFSYFDSNTSVGYSADMRVHTGDNEWIYSHANLENRYFRTTTITGYESSTTNYPSTKAVADYAMTKANPTGTGSMSLNRKADTTTGSYSTAMGYNGEASGSYSTIAGGQSNTASKPAATVSGGYSNNASGAYSTISGGSSNISNTDFTTVGGGYQNTSSGNCSTVAGGYINTASNNCATVGGGSSNTASGYRATIGGGQENTASGDLSTISGGNGNIASGYMSTISGGNINTASGNYSAVLSGYKNTAQTQSQTVIGAYNALDTGGSTTARGNWAFVIGNGLSTTDENGNVNETRSNAHTVSWDGTGWYATDVQAGANKVSLLTAEQTANKTTTITSSSTDTEYPSAKAVADYVSTNAVTLDGTQTITGVKTFTGATHFTGSGDVNSIRIGLDTRVNVEGTSNTVLGFMNNVFTINRDTYKLNLRGASTRPMYNGADMALLSDVTSETTRATGVEATKEDLSNKVTSITSSSTDTQYPSAKAVYDFAENASKWYWCTYGTTTAEEIQAALDGGKTPVCFYTGSMVDENGNETDAFKDTLFVHAYTSDSGNHVFGASYAAAVSDESVGCIAQISCYASGSWGTKTTNTQSVANRVNSISGTGSNLHYPSTKAVVDYVADQDKFFWCTYNTTTYAEITTAITEGKTPVCIYPGSSDDEESNAYANQLFIYARNYNNWRHDFIAVYGPTYYTMTVESTDNWSVTSGVVEYQEHKTTTVSSSSTDTEYPSAKAVYTAIQGSATGVTDVKVDGTSVVTDKVANINGKEDNSNKVTSMSESSTDTEYPSAKCVYDAIQGITPADSKWFFCTYGTTTYAEITEAINNGKTPVVVYTGSTTAYTNKLFTYSGIVSNSYTFGSIYLNTVYSITVSSSSTWSSVTSTSLELSTYKVSSIGTGSTYQYPTTKAVVDYAEKKPAAWTKIASWTTAAGKSFDLTGYTEILLCGSVTATAEVGLYANFTSATSYVQIMPKCASTTTTYLKASWKDFTFDTTSMMKAEWCSSGTAPAKEILGNSTCTQYDILNKSTATMTCINFGNYTASIQSVSLTLYAR